MSTSIAHQTDKEIARPLRVLAPLIKEDLRHGNEAARTAAMPYYRAAGEKMNEAKPQFDKSAEFYAWINRNFSLGRRQADRYMEFAAARMRTSFSSMREYQRHVGIEANNIGRTTWHEPVKKILGRVDISTLRDTELKRADEREAQRKLALQLIDIGYKALATKLHPDKGGSRDAMARLNQVRDRLKAHV